MKPEYSRAVSALVAAMFSVILFGAPAAAQSGDVFTLVGSADTVSSGEGWALDVAVSGNYAYVGYSVAGQVRAYDISNMSAPALVGTVTVGHSVSNVLIDGTYAYAVWWEGSGGGLSIVNVADPSSPVLAATYPTAGPANSIAVANGYAYLAETTGLRILDVSDPSAPALVGSYVPSDSPWRVAAAGNLVYLVLQGGDIECGRQLHVVDVSNPAEPVKTGSCCLPDSYDESWGDYLSVFCYEVAVQGGYAYVGWADGWTGGTFAGRLDTIDISDPANPVRCSIYTTYPGVRGLAQDGANTYLFLKQDSLVGVDTTDPCGPRFLGNTQTWGTMNGCARDGFVYLANGLNQDLMIFEVDSDRDSLPDHDETVTDPYNWDSDGDHLSDGEEVLTYETDPLDRDSDGDGVDDGKEVAWGSDPLDPNDTVVLPLTVLGGLAGALGLAGLAILRRRGARI